MKLKLVFKVLLLLTIIGLNANAQIVGQWATKIGGSSYNTPFVSDDIPNDMAFDGDGNIYVVGKLDHSADY